MSEPSAGFPPKLTALRGGAEDGLGAERRVRYMRRRAQSERWELDERTGRYILREANEFTETEHSPDPPAELTKADYLGRITLLGEGIEERRQQLDEEVLKARRTGASWGDIGDALHIRPQSAHQRWRKLEQESEGDS